MLNASKALTVALLALFATTLVGKVTAKVVATPGAPVSVKVTEDPVSPAAVAVKWLVPARLPRIAVTDALPSGPVVPFAETKLPAPEATVQVMAKVGTALPLASSSWTTSKFASADPATPVCASPALICSLVGAAPATQNPAALQAGYTPGQLLVS